MSIQERVPLPLLPQSSNYEESEKDEDKESSRLEEEEDEKGEVIRLEGEVRRLEAQLEARDSQDLVSKGRWR